MTNLMTFENVSKTYPSGKSTIEALKPTNFSAASGELIAIVGPSGSGKSTFLSLAGALISPTTGTISINGRDISTLKQKERTDIRLEEIGFIFQAAYLVPYLKVKEQITFIGRTAGKTKSEANQEADVILEQLGLGDRKQFYPKDLSGGEKQRVAIARAIINQPSIILADEPTASLDSKRSREVVELLRSEVVGTDRAAIMVTHDERMLDLCDHVYYMEDGLLTKQK